MLIWRPSENLISIFFTHISLFNYGTHFLNQDRKGTEGQFLYGLQ
jgi:hypothetical protein